MSKVVIELDREFEQALEGVAASERKSTQQVCREAVEDYIRRRLAPDRKGESDRRSGLRKMVGMVKGGPTDASIFHDGRAGEEM